MERDLKTALKWTSVVFALVTLVVALGGGAPEKPEAPPRRIARIEVPAQEAPPAEAPVAPVAEQVAEASVEVPRAEVPAQAAAGAAAKPRFETAKDQPKRAGLNTPAPVSDVNSVGILAALKKGGAPGPGIKAEQIEVARQSSESISGGDAARVMLRNPPAGVLGSGSSGGGQSASGGLSAASTTLAQGGQYDPSSKGAIARQGGTVGAGLGSGLEGSGKGTSGSGADLDGAAGFAVEGGLDRETVRRVIAAYRNQIRACYERALLMQAKIEGRITYQWTISSQGPVLTAEVLSSTIAMPPLELCVLDVIKSMKFPAAPNGKGTRVKYPFVFQGFR